MGQTCPFLDVTPARIATYISSLGQFTMTQIRASRAGPAEADEQRLALRTAANLVQLAVDEPVTIADAVAAIHRSVRPGQIYESWAAGVLRAAYSSARSMNCVCKEALMVAIDAEELRRAAADESAAIAEARAVLYGDEGAEADGYDPDDELGADGAHDNDPGRLQAMHDDVDFGDEK